MSVDTPILKDVGSPDADLIKNTTTKDFMRDVVEASREDYLESFGDTSQDRRRGN